MKKVLCIGGVTVDIIVSPVKQLPKEGTLAAVEQIVTYVGGCAASAALDMGRLGMPVTLCCKVGEDAFGDFIRKELEKNQVDVRGMVQTAQTGTSASVVTVNSSGERSFLYYPGSTSELTEEEIPDQLVEESDIVFIASALLLSRLDGKGAANILKKARALGKYTVMDTVWDHENRWMEKIEDALPFLDLFMPSIEEAEKLTGETDLDRIVDCFRKRGVKNVIIKNGSHGAYICEEGKKRFVSPPFLQKNPVDTNGAGDSFCAGFLCGLSRGYGYRESARFANAVGSHCVMGRGTYSGVPHMKIIDEFLERVENGR